MANGRAASGAANESRARDAVFWAFGLVVASALLVVLAKPLLLLFAGFLCAIVLRASASFVQRVIRLPYWASLVTCIVVSVALAALVVILSAATVDTEFHDLGSALPKALSSLAASLHLPLKGSLDHALGGFEQMIEHALPAFGGSLEALSGLVVLVFFGIYGAADPSAYLRIALWFVPREKRARARHVLEVGTRNLERWLIGRLVAMAFVAIACAVAFTALHVPLALPLALLAGLLTFVEYVGAVASGIPPVLLAFSQSPTRALWVLLFFTGLHIVEGYVLTPLLTRSTVHLPPASTLATQVLLAALLGPLGLTFATPLLVVAVTIAQEWRPPRARAEANARDHQRRLTA